jgi:putative FmdB family regulatory protein
MPTYEYKCLSCNNIFEMFQTMTAEPVKTCPNCGGLVKRLIGTGAGPIFKGSGFYQTDYKNKSAGSSSKVSSESKEIKKNDEIRKDIKTEKKEEGKKKKD